MQVMVHAFDKEVQLCATSARRQRRDLGSSPHGGAHEAEEEQSGAGADQCLCCASRKTSAAASAQSWLSSVRTTKYCGLDGRGRVFLLGPVAVRGRCGVSLRGKTKQDDIEMTNKSDKETQLLKLLDLSLKVVCQTQTGNWRRGVVGQIRPVCAKHSKIFFGFNESTVKCYLTISKVVKSRGQILAVKSVQIFALNKNLTTPLV